MANEKVKTTTSENTDEKQKNEGPSCACGRVDLYEDWLKQNEKEKDEFSSTASKSDNQIKASDVAGKSDTKAVPIKSRTKSKSV